MLAKGADGFKSYVDKLDNRRVKWSGTVTETRKWHEDDYVPAAGMLVDTDGKPGPDVFVNISVDTADKLKPGAAVTFTATLLGSTEDKGRLLIKLEAEKVQ